MENLVYIMQLHSYFIEPKFDKIVLYTNKKYNNMWEVKNSRQSWTVRQFREYNI